MVPLTTAEIIICVADKFFSKSPDHNTGEKSMETVIKSLESIDPDHAARFSAWVDELMPLSAKV
jgi:uncharacterized protein